jgi:hypothetical protein
MTDQLPLFTGEDRPRRFPRTRVALAHYDATYEARCFEHNALSLEAFMAVDKAALDLVREAFFLDTADRNRRDQAMGAQLDWLREWVAQDD